MSINGINFRGRLGKPQRRDSSAQITTIDAEEEIGEEKLVQICTFFKKQHFFFDNEPD